MEISALIKRWLCCIVFLPYMCSGQILENFSDGDFISNPSWSGDQLNFKINNEYQLQLDDADAGSSFLYTPVEVFPEMEWRCWIKQSFSPSGNNYSRIYLLADEQLASFPPDGIFLQLGEGGSDDAIRLMQQINNDTSTLIRGSPGAISSSFECRVKIVFSENQWHLLADYSGSEIYIQEGNTNGTMPGTNGFFGFVCNYTSSNSTKFYFDDIYAGTEQKDSIPPQVENVFVRSPLQLEVGFSEKPEEESALLMENYTLQSAQISIDSVRFHQEKPLAVMLYLHDSLPYAIMLHLEVENIRDPSGNEMLASQHSLAWYYPEKYDVLINEIMADPSPPKLLPDYEYLELMNTHDLPLDLSGWTLHIGDVERGLSDLLIAPHDYLILGKEDAKNDFSAFGDFYGFESFSLTNGGQSVFLSNSDGFIMSGLQYDDSWYRDEEKEEGGWSLELINPENPCLGPENWKASEDYRGGSPGMQNSILENIYFDPEIISACAIDSVRISVEFSHSMGMALSMAPESFYIDHGIGNAMAVLPTDPFFTSFTIYPAKALLPGIVYELSCTSPLVDCMGDSAQITETKALGLPQKPLWQDLVINEILFNPFPGGDDYVEIYNRSEKAISMSGVLIASVRNNSPAPPDTTMAVLYKTCSVLLPGEYALLCKRYERVSDYYTTAETNELHEIVNFPSYSNAYGNLLLYDKDMALLDAFSYREDMHYPLLNIVEGVSLERIHYDRPTDDESNWHSASSLSGYGTPGYKNSQFSESSSDDGNIQISPRVISPNNDGQNDLLNVSYAFDRPGYLASIMVFSASGQLVRQLVNNELLGTSGSYSWDGFKDDRQKATSGIYIILFELTDLGGKIIRYKETAVVAPY